MTTTTMMSRLVPSLQQVARRSFGSSARREVKNTIQEKQKHFQQDNGLPVHLKAGARDVLLYRATMVITVGGTAYALYQLGKACFPQKKD